MIITQRAPRQQHPRLSAPLSPRLQRDRQPCPFTEPSRRRTTVRWWCGRTWGRLRQGQCTASAARTLSSVPHTVLTHSWPIALQACVMPSAPRTSVRWWNLAKLRAASDAASPVSASCSGGHRRVERPRQGRAQDGHRGAWRDRSAFAPRFLVALLISRHTRSRLQAAPSQKVVSTESVKPPASKGPSK